MNAWDLSALSNLSPELLGELEAALQKQLLALSYRAFSSVVRRLLERMGYRQVRSLGRHHRRGRTAEGGGDLLASVEAELTRSVLILQIKQYRRPVSRRFVDELRGSCLRLRAQQGMLLSTASFSRPAIRAALTEGALPVRLVSGGELVRLLILHRIGVSETLQGLQIDRAYFDLLHARFPATGSERTPPDPPPAGPQGDRALSTRRGDWTTQLLSEGGHMTWRTHFVFGINSLWLLTLLPTTGNSPGALAALAALGALLPDLDAQDAKVKHLSLGNLEPLAPVSSLLHTRLGHRGLLHSLLALLGLALLSLPLGVFWGAPAALALTLGYASHLLLDACTKSGVPFLFPNRRRYHLLPKGSRLTTGSQAEELLFVLFASLAVLILISHLSSAL